MRDITWDDISNYNEKEKYLDDLVNTNIRTQVLSLKDDDIVKSFESIFAESSILSICS